MRYANDPAPLVGSIAGMDEWERRTGAMRTIAMRVRNLEKQFGTADGNEQIVLVVCKPGWGVGVAFDRDRCIQILRETGFLPTGSVALVNLIDVPDGMNAEQTELFLREHAVEICNFPQSRPLADQPAQAPGPQ
jgi:hypothetical protein